MKLKISFTKYFLCVGVLALGLFIGCQPEEFEGAGNGLSGDPLDPTFTITPVNVAGKSNTYIFTAKEADAVGVFWDLEGSGDFTAGLARTDTVFFPDAGTYPIALRVVGKGGETYESSQNLVVDSPDPVAGNLVIGGRFDEGDEANWSILQYGGTTQTPVFVGGKALFSYGGWAQTGIYQAVQIEAGKKYRLDMSVAGSGATNSWFEVYIGTAVPTNSSDYNDGGSRLGLHTWTGCGTTRFSDKLTKLACIGSLKGDVNGIVEFSISGTYYLVIRTGGENLGTEGIALDNVELRPYVE